MAHLAVQKVQEKKKKDIEHLTRLEDAMAIEDANAESAHPCHAGITFVASCSIDCDSSCSSSGLSI